MATKSRKGPALEELLRDYFRNQGYFVARGVKYKFGKYDVTDVDLWLYKRTSPSSRERVNVDIKNKRTPQAIERIFWSRGLRLALGLERTIVATTDRRPEVREFGRRNEVDVLDGTFIALLKSKHKVGIDRFTEEEFNDALGSKLNREKYEHAKSGLITHLDYSGCNQLSQEIAAAAERAISTPTQRKGIVRLVYILVAHFLLSLDYVLKDLSFMSDSLRAESVREGLVHGPIGQAGLDDYLEEVGRIIRAYLPDGGNLASQLRKEVLEEFESVPADIIKEYVTKSANAKGLLDLAYGFENAAFSVNDRGLEELNHAQKAILFMMLDYVNIDRKSFADSTNGDTDPDLFE